MEKITLFIDDDKITPEEFRKWVDQVTRKLYGLYPTANGPWATQGGAWFTTPNKIPISAFYITKTDGDKPFYNPVEIGYVDVNRLGQRLKVVFAYSRDPELAEYFSKFLNEFIGDWPEAIPQNNKTNPPIEKQKGRYRLTDDEINYRKDKVSEANKIKKESPDLYWKEIAKRMDIRERTLRDWRHNPIYK